MLTQKQLFSWIFGALLFTGLIFAVYLSSTTGTATASTEASGTTGPLKFVVRMSKPTYLTGEMVIAHANLTNTGNIPISVFKPLAPFSLLYSLDGVEVVRGDLCSSASMRGPSPSDVVTLAPGSSISVSLNLSTKDVVSPLPEGRHTLMGHYTTSDIPLKGFWRGDIKTSLLTFTVSSPTGAEANAYQLYQKLLSLYRSGDYPENFGQTKAIAADLIARFPQSVYVSCALWKVAPQLFSMKQHDDIIALTEAYFALKRSDDAYIVKGIGRFSAQAYYHLGNYRKALAVLDKYTPGEDSWIRGQIEAALRGK